MSLHAQENLAYNGCKGHIGFDAYTGAPESIQTPSLFVSYILFKMDKTASFALNLHTQAINNFYKYEISALDF